MEHLIGKRFNTFSEAYEAAGGNWNFLVYEPNLVDGKYFPTITQPTSKSVMYAAKEFQDSEGNRWYQFVEAV